MALWYRSHLILEGSSIYPMIWKSITMLYETCLSTFWSVDVLVCRRFGLTMFWFVDVLVCRRFGLSTFRSVDVLVCRRFDLSTFWFVDVSVCRRFGLSTFWLSTFRFVDVLTSYLLSYVKPIWQPMDNSGNVAWHEALQRWWWQRNNRVPDPVTQFNHTFFIGHDSIFMLCSMMPYMVESAWWLLMPWCLFGTRTSATTMLTYSIKPHHSFIRCASIMVDASWNIAGQKNAGRSDNKK